MTDRRAAVGFVLAGLGWAAAACTVLGFAGSLWWTFDLVANWRPQLAASLAVLGVVYTLAYGRAVGLAFVAAALVNLAVVAPYYIAGTPAALPGSPELKIVSFNVQASNADRVAVMDYLARTDADIVFLLESSFEWEDAVEAAGLRYEMVATVPADRSFGITYLARPDIDTTPVDLQLPHSQVLAATVAMGDRNVTVMAIHPMSPTSPGRSQGRDDLLSAAGRWLEGNPGLEIVVGDLNASPWSHAFRSLARRADLRNSLKGHGLQPSWPVGWGPLMIPIDHALLSRDLAAVGRATGPDLGSDHRPLEVTVAFRG